MKGLRIALIAIMWLGFASLLAYAQEAAVNSPGTAGMAKAASSPAKATAEPAKEDDRLPIQKLDEWQFFLSPYMWIPGINANVSTLKKTTHTDIPWWEVASTLFSKSIGVMGRAEAWKGRWGVFVDGYFTYAGASGSQVGVTREKSFGPIDFTVDKTIQLRNATATEAIPGQIGRSTFTLTPSGSVKFISRLGNLDLGARFLVGTLLLSADKPLPALSLELLGGPRFNSINQYTRINLSAVTTANVPIDIGKFSFTAKHQSVHNGAYVIDINKQYFEPFLGARVSLWLSPKVIVTLKGDVGGFGFIADDHVDCNFEALAGYRVHKNIYVYAGYRAQGAWYNLGQDLAAVNLSAWAHGPVLGTTFAF